jgi:membrane-bound lytic murein transglycosylase D
MIYSINFAAEHNLYEDSREEFLPHDTLVVSKFFHFDTFSKLTGTCTEDLLALNPTIRKNAVPEDGLTRVIKIPKGIKAILEANRNTILDSVAAGKKEWETVAKNTSNQSYGKDRSVYYVRYGDVLGTIARRFGVSVSNLKQWNNLRGNMIRTGQRLTIWVAPSSNQSSIKNPSIVPSTSSLTNDKTYIVQPGDTLWDISKKIPGITIDKIKSLNNIKGNKLQPGQKLIVG